jgi:hypothetical protein
MALPHLVQTQPLAFAFASNACFVSTVGLGGIVSSHPECLHAEPHSPATP